MNRGPGFPSDPRWSGTFRGLEGRLGPVVAPYAVRGEHVGSTSVPGRHAKPIIDIDIVVGLRNDVVRVGEALATLGYEARGELGITDRFAFRLHGSDIHHNLYVCVSGSAALRNHLTLRDHLRAYPDDRRAYGELKVELARRFPHDMDAYVEGKSSFIQSILSRYDAFDAEELAEIEDANRSK